MAKIRFYVFVCALFMASSLGFASPMWVRINSLVGELPSFVRLQPVTNSDSLIEKGNETGNGPCELRFDRSFDKATGAYTNASLCVSSASKQVCVVGRYGNDRAFVYAEAGQTRIESEDQKNSISLILGSASYQAIAQGEQGNIACEIR